MILYYQEKSKEIGFDYNIFLFVTNKIFLFVLVVEKKRLELLKWENGKLTKRRRVDIARYQEIRWKGAKFCEISDDYKALLYNCASTKRKGVAIVVAERFREKISFVERIRDRLMAIKIMLAIKLWTSSVLMPLNLDAAMTKKEILAGAQRLCKRNFQTRNYTS